MAISATDQSVHFPCAQSFLREMQSSDLQALSEKLALMVFNWRCFVSATEYSCIFTALSQRCQICFHASCCCFNLLRSSSSNVVVMTSVWHTDSFAGDDVYSNNVRETAVSMSTATRLCYSLYHVACTVTR